MSRAPDRVGVIVIRLWMEEDGLRARVTYTSDIADPSPSSSAAAGAGETIARVRSYVELWREDGRSG